MKRTVMVVLLGATALVASWLYSCQGTALPKHPQGAQVYLQQQTDSLILYLYKLSLAVQQKKPLPELRERFAVCRRLYKGIEPLVEYYFQGLVRRINGPALPDVKPEDGQVWPPHGLQVIEQYLYGGDAGAVAALSNEIKLLQTDLRFVKANMPHHTISPAHLHELVQHQLIRMAALGISGADAPLSQLSMWEAAYSLQGLQRLLASQQMASPPSLQGAIQYLLADTAFDRFDRMAFLRQHLIPISRALDTALTFSPGVDTLMRPPFKGTLAELLQGKGFDADAYAAYAVAASNPAKVALGKQLFADRALSANNSISCASCHQPSLYFTDGRPQATNLVHGGHLLRNTPSLYYAALQSHQFWDLRSTTLEDQINEVMRNGQEFGLPAAVTARRLMARPGYAALFKQAFPASDSIGSFEVRNAIAAYVRSLSPMASPFDRYMAGDTAAMGQQQVQGFNLFMGKAKCGTCHFVPLFNGNLPPWFTKSESEIIGVPLSIRWQAAQIDADEGRYRINRMDDLLYAFKTPTVRNAAKTAPYMHNGVYASLEQVVDFYQRGGGSGIGIELPTQTLPFDSLQLTAADKKALIAFMESLTDPPPQY
jgi:cytochrome c peroxidase